MKNLFVFGSFFALSLLSGCKESDDKTTTDASDASTDVVVTDSSDEAATDAGTADVVTSDAPEDSNLDVAVEATDAAVE